MGQGKGNEEKVDMKLEEGERRGENGEKGMRERIKENEVKE